MADHLRAPQGNRRRASTGSSAVSETGSTVEVDSAGNRVYNQQPFQSYGMWMMLTRYSKREGVGIKSHLSYRKPSWLEIDSVSVACSNWEYPPGWNASPSQDTQHKVTKNITTPPGLGSVSSRECLDAPAIFTTFKAGCTGLVACP